MRDGSGGAGRRAFTLIELLVVVAVIAVLIGVLLPALGAAQESARGVRCLSQMRQVAYGWQVYANNNADVVVPVQPGRYSDESRNVYWVGNGEQYRPRWFAAMGAQVGIFAYNNPSADPADEHSLEIDNEVFICPEAPEWVSTRNCSYGYNYQFLGNTRFRANDEEAGFINFPVYASTVRAPASTVMFADSMGTAAGKPEGVRAPNRADGSRDPDLRALGGHGYALDPPRLPGDHDYADRRNRAPEHRSAPHERHGGKAHAAFVDAHVEAVTLDELGYEVATDGRVLADGERATNRRFTGTGRDRDPPPLSAGP